jgi:ferredoxin
MIKDDETCIRCGLCAVRCPTDAMTMEVFYYEEHERFE